MSKVKRHPFNIDSALDSIDMNFSNYTPSRESLDFFNLIRVFMGEDFEIPNPKFHYFLVDMLYGIIKREQFPYSEEIVETLTINPSRIGVISSRGSAKSTIATLFYPIVCAIKGTSPVTGAFSHMLILSDSQQGGARDQALLMGNAFNRSEFAKEHFEKIRFTESEVELIRAGTTSIEKRHMLIKFKGAQANSLDSMLFTDTGRVSIGDVSIGDKIFGADGKLCTVTDKSEVFNRDMYTILLKDGRVLKVSDDHINSIMYKNNNYTDGTPYEKMDLTTKDLLELEMWKVNPKSGHATPRMWIENCKPIAYSEKQFSIDPYTLGLVLGDGYFHIKDGSVKLTGSTSDMEYYYTQIPYEIGYVENKGTNSVATIKGLSKAYRRFELDDCKAPDKFIPTEYKYGSVEQRLALLQGLIDTDGTIANGNKGSRFMSTSKRLTDDVIDLVRSLGGVATVGISNYASDEPIDICGCATIRNYDVYRVYIKLNMPVARLPRKVNKLSIKQRDSKVAIVNIAKMKSVPSQCIVVDNEEHQYIVEEYFRTHNSGGIRSGSRNPITGDRYAIIIADDVIKNEAESYSPIIMKNVTTALNSDALNAMRAKKTQLILINTPFHKKDPVYKSVESGGFTPLVTPICKKIYEGMPKEEMQCLWEEMHDYDSIMDRYMNAVSGDSTKAFNQELMLRVASVEDRLIKEGEIQKYSRRQIEPYIGNYKLVATTDYTASNSKKGDFSGTALWAVSSIGDWFMLDLSLKKEGIEEQYQHIFRMVQRYMLLGATYIEVGVELDGQQQLNIHSLKNQMREKNIYFSFSKQIGKPYGSEGFRRAGASKHAHFMRIHPLFQNKKIYFPEELDDTPDMKELLEELKGVTYTAFTSVHDDGLDLCSAIGLLEVTLPSSEPTMAGKVDTAVAYKGGVYADFEEEVSGSKNSVVF